MVQTRQVDCIITIDKYKRLNGLFDVNLPLISAFFSNGCGFFLPKLMELVNEAMEVDADGVDLTF